MLTCRSEGDGRAVEPMRRATGGGQERTMILRNPEPLVATAKLLVE